MRKIFPIILITFIIAGCASCNKTNQQKPEQNINKSVLKKPVEPGLSPGSVLLSATLLERKTNKTFNTLQLKVNKVHDYGHSTPTLAKGERINVVVKDKNLMNLLSENKSSKVLLKHSPQKAGDKTSTEWILINIK